MGRASRGKTSSCINSCQVELLSSSAERGAQNARLPHAYEKASTTTTEHASDNASRPSQASVSGTCNCTSDQPSSNNPGSSMPAPVTGANPSVSSTIHSGYSHDSHQVSESIAE